MLQKSLTAKCYISYSILLRGRGICQLGKPCSQEPVNTAND
ncbi:hypothetical protein COLSTE_00233 [Collinsella stercoris DSM 13279]|uniref:Uncharacterized protein n=1 Tax=Collinsella stercoris DSM 13279 TaxID=445975 RepID=B6G843_9ACTN|nr:hypothetical protein COLSTE_00233 [Collinsella stercoris DSM 13279]